MMDEVVREAQSHLSNVHRVITRLSCQTRMTSASTTGDHPLSQIRKIVCQSVSEVARHSPIIVCGDPGSGKTSLLSQVFTQSQEWLEESRGPETEVVRIVRLLARSPTSSYAPELLRSLCQQMCLELHHLLEMQDLLTDCETSLTSRFQVRLTRSIPPIVSWSAFVLFSFFSFSSTVCMQQILGPTDSTTTRDAKSFQYSLECLHCSLPSSSLLPPRLVLSLVTHESFRFSSRFLVPMTALP